MVEVKSQSQDNPFLPYLRVFILIFSSIVQEYMVLFANQKTYTYLKECHIEESATRKALQSAR